MVLVDIDGTLSILGDRLRHLGETPKNWDMFYARCAEDLPDEPMINLVSTLIESGTDVVFCTGRRESERQKTIMWLEHHLGTSVSNDSLLMRPDGDHRHDTVLKPELVVKAGWPINRIDFVLEDRDSVVAMWRSIGVKCLQVARGDF